MKVCLSLLLLVSAAAIVSAQAGSFYDLKTQTLLGKPADLGDFRGKVTLVVNVASYCGYTPQYKGLEALHRELKDKGFAVLGFPSNDFGEQEPGTAEEIATFCKRTYDVSFPMFSKSPVAKGTVNPFYAKLAQASGSRPQWNFHKYLVDRKGEKVLAYESAVEPGDPKLVKAIETLLAQP